MSKAANIANNLFTKYKLSVPVDLVDLARKLDIILEEAPLKSMSGFAYQKDGKKVIGINETDSDLRKRFTLAHELGHMLVHADLDVTYDKKNAFVYFRDDNSSTGANIREIEANAFAAELLMPATQLTQRIEQLQGVDPAADDDKVRKLADEFNVSFTAMSVRIDSLARHAYK